MAEINTYLFFPGTCAEAMTFYEKTTGGKLDMVPASQAPDAGPASTGAGALIMHARLELPGGAVLMASDWMDPSPYTPMQGFAVSILYEGVEEARRVFDILVDGGKASMPFGKTFFAEGFGMLKDRYGTPWMVGAGMAG